jgi:hypothetical protein
MKKNELQFDQKVKKLEKGVIPVDSFFGKWTLQEEMV